MVIYISRIPSGMNERGPFSFASVPGITFVWSVGSNILLNSLYSKVSTYGILTKY